MSAIFISHSSRDNHVADEIRQWLARQGHRSVFLDFDPANGIPAGRDWEQELYRGIRACRAVIVLCSRHSMASRWCFMEITHARALGKHLFPVKIDDCDIDGVLTDRQVIDLTANKQEALQRLWHGILASGLDPADAFDWDGSRPAYPGLLAFQEEDAAIFFGRDDEIGDGLDVVNKVRRLGQTGLVMVLGASGTGKSSLVRAGLVPRLRRDTERWLVVDPFRPRDDPARALATVLSRAFDRVGRTLPWERIYARLREAMERVSSSVEEAPLAVEATSETAEKEWFLQEIDKLEASLPSGAGPQAARYLRLLRSTVDTEAAGPGTGGTATPPDDGNDILGELADDLRRRSGRDETRVLLLIDQFEELLGHDPAHQNSRFLQLLRTSLDRPGSPLLALGTMRSDFLGQFQKSPALLDVHYESLSLGPMSSEDVAQVIEKPAHLATIDLEPGLVQTLVADAETEDALPLLAFTLRELNERYGKDGLLEVHEYRDRLGGLQGAVAKAAEDLLASEYLDEEQEAQLRAAFLAMVRMTEDGTYARRTAHWDTLPPAVHPLLEQFVQGRLLVAGSDEQGRTLEVAHEALFRSWDRLVHWLEESAEALRLHHEIRVASRSWDQGGRQEEDLWRGGRLARARELRESGDLPLTALDLEFVEASNHAEQALILAEEAQRLRELRRSRTIAAVSLAAFLIAVVGIIVVLFLRNQAETARKDADTARLAAVHSDSLAREEAREAQRQRGIAEDSTRAAQRQRLRADSNAAIAEVERDNARAAQQAAQDSAEVAAQQRDSARVAQQQAEEQRQRAEEQTEVATNARKQTLGIGLASKAKRQEEDGELELGALLAREAFLFNQSSGGEFINEVYDALRKTLDALPGEAATSQVLSSSNNDWVRSVAYSPTNRWIAAAGNDGKVYLWHPGISPPDTTVLPGHTETDRSVTENAIHHLVFSPNNDALATLGDDRTLRLWRNLDQPAPSMTILGNHRNPVWAVAFSPDGRLLASASQGNTIRIWNARSGTEEASLPTQGFAVRALAFSPDGRMLAAGCNDGTIRLWSVQNTASRPTILDAHQGSVNAVAFNRDGTRLASGGKDQVVRVWTMAGGIATLREALRGHEGPVNVVAFHPRGEGLASGSSDQTVRLWQLDRPGVGPIILDGHTAWVQSLAFSPDGATLVSGSADRTVRTWKTDAADLADAICDAVTRALTPQEWRDYVGGDIEYCEAYVPCHLEKPTSCPKETP